MQSTLLKYAKKSGQIVLNQIVLLGNSTSKTCQNTTEEGDDFLSTYLL